MKHDIIQEILVLYDIRVSRHTSVLHKLNLRSLLCLRRLMCEIYTIDRSKYIEDYISVFRSLSGRNRFVKISKRSLVKFLKLFIQNLQPSVSLDERTLHLLNKIILGKIFIGVFTKLVHVHYTYPV
jgi:hypothetical protein